MLKLLRRFSRRQKILLGSFVAVAVVGTVLAFFMDQSLLIAALFWMLALTIFVMIMIARRLNAKIVRMSRAQGGAQPSKKVAARPNRLNSAASLETLRTQYEKKRTPETALPLARKLIQEKGDITQARKVVEPIRNHGSLREDEQGYLRRIDSLAKYLTAEVELPQRHRTTNYLPRRGKVMYAVGMSPVSVGNGYTSRTRGVAEGLTGQGLDVVVAPMPGKPWDKKPQPGFTVPDEHRRYVEQINGVTYAHNPGVPAWEGDLDVFFQVSADAYVREAMIEKPETILAASNYLSALPALMAARRLGVPFVYEMRGFWEVSAASVKKGWADSDQYRLDRRMENLVAENADRIVVITEEMRQDLIGRGIAGEKITVAPNCVDTEEFAPLGKDSALLRRLGFANPDLPVVGFAGSVTDYEGLDLVVEALADLKNRGSQFNFLVMGAGAYLEELKALVSQRGLDNETRYISGVPSQQMPVYLSSIDIFPLARKSLPVTELVSPLKPLEAMSVGGAVLLSDVSPHQVFYGEDQVRARGFAKDDVASLAGELEKLINNPQGRRAMGVQARRWVVENRQWSVTGTAIARALRSAHDAVSEVMTHLEEKPLKAYKVAFIGDTFTSETFVPELTALRVTPEDWRQRFAEEQVDALFIESAWQGNDKAWDGIIGYYGDETHAPIVELIAHCREHGIPVMFWNKEDPVHFNRFKRTAALCDYVFTTDARTILDYNALPDHHIKAVASAPFSAQPLLHNPLPSTRPQDEAIAYGGTYYGDKYATRKQGLDFLFYESAPYGLAIYERVHNDPNSPYRLPDRFRRYARQSLSYPEMCQAYKAHPIHLNGNSVVDSPSMFSRRVVEIAASGSNVISSPGRGVDETLAGTIPTVGTPDEANAVLERWKSSEQVRHEDLWAAMRHVDEAHRCANRLVYMMRVAGFLVQSPQRPRVAVECTAAQIPTLEAQTIRPDLYLVTDRPSGQAASAPIVALGATERLDEVRARGIDYVIRVAESVTAIEPHQVADLLSALQHGDWEAVGFRQKTWTPGDPYIRIAALSADIDQDVVLYPAETYGAVTTGASPQFQDDQVFAWQRVTDAVSADQQVQQEQSTEDMVPTAGTAAAQAAAPRSILMAGHDFKFTPQIRAVLERAGHTVTLDEWGGHDIHDEAESRRLLADADVIFCEWALGNVKWYSKNKKPGQRLIVRIHAQELRSRFLGEATLDAVDAFIFVSPVVQRRAQMLFGIPAERCIVVGNTFDFDSFAAPRQSLDAHVLGMVGSVPQSKRLDLALDIVQELRREDPDYRLVVKGKEYSEYAWLMGREKEREYFEAQYARMASAPELQGAVEFGGHSSDIAAWYRSVPGFILSTSDHEGTHQAVAEGGAAGCIPIIFPWAGAEFVYGDRWIVESTAEAAERIRTLAADPERFQAESEAVRAYMREHFTPQVIGEQILRVVEG